MTVFCYFMWRGFARQLKSVARRCEGLKWDLWTWHSVSPIAVNLGAASLVFCYKRHFAISDLRQADLHLINWIYNDTLKFTKQMSLISVMFLFLCAFNSRFSAIYFAFDLNVSMVLDFAFWSLSPLGLSLAIWAIHR